MWKTEATQKRKINMGGNLAECCKRKRENEKQEITNSEDDKQMILHPDLKPILKRVSRHPFQVHRRKFSICFQLDFPKHCALNYSNPNPSLSP